MLLEKDQSNNPRANLLFLIQLPWCSWGKSCQRELAAYVPGVLLQLG